MSVSKISRSLVVAIFVVVIILIGSQSIYLNISNLNISENSSISRLMYTLLLLLFFIMYGVIKSRFNKRRLVKRLSLFYRYVYLVVIAFFIKIISINIYVEDINIIYLIVCSILGAISAVCIKKIIYNVSKSDMLSVLGMFMFILLPNILNDSDDYLRSVCMNLSTLLYVVFMQKLIDELKQPNVKTLKYIKLSSVVGIFIAFSVLTGIYSYIYLIIGFVMLFITSDLDKTNINIPNKVISKLRQKNKEVLYRIERIYINKKYISILAMLLMSVIAFYLLGGVIGFINNDHLSNVFINYNNSITYNINSNVTSMNLSLNNLLSEIGNIANNAKTYYLVLIIYILFLEVLTAILRRRYDTKSTILKTLFICLIVFSVIFKYNTLVFYQLYTSLLILIAITNTSNIYLNRDERIKLLN